MLVAFLGVTLMDRAGKAKIGANLQSHPVPVGALCCCQPEAFESAGCPSRATQKIEQFGLLINPMSRFNRWREAGVWNRMKATRADCISMFRLTSNRVAGAAR